MTYCSYEVAMLLKEKGFDIGCYGRYSTRSKEFHFDATRKCENHGLFIIAAPTHQMAMKWLREVYGLSVEIFSIKGTSNVCPVFWKGNVVKLLTQDRVFSGELVGSYEESVEAALKYCLKNLI